MIPEWRVGNIYASFACFYEFLSGSWDCLVDAIVDELW